MKYSIDYLRVNGERALVERGINKADAFIIIDSMLLADMSDIVTHGIRMLPAYLEKIDKGEFSIDQQPAIIKSKSSYTIINANNSVGAISGNKAVEVAIEKAKISGIHLVLSRNANTLGPAFYYSEKIANAGMIGFVCCNSPAAMPVNNGLEALLGTNPLSFACPSYSKGMVLVDMATSIVSKSRFLVAKNNGELLKEGWALDNKGNPTIDPVEAIKGLVLPMAGVKGYALALMIDLLSGLLSGSAYLNNVGKFYSQNGESMNVGHVVVAVNPLEIFEGDFYKEMDKYIDTIRFSKAYDGKKISIPGDRKFMARDKNRNEGIELSEDTIIKLRRLSVIE